MLTGPLKIRVNGFQFPPSCDQIKTLTTYPFTVICYYLILSIALPRDDDYLVMLLLVLNGVLSIFLFVAWVTVEYLDPEQKQNRTGIPILCYSTPEKSARYCGACRKTVSGLDHHCTWLNTCVGRRNYFSFICLVFLGAAQSTLHSTIGFISLLLWISNEETSSRILTLFKGKMWAFYLVVCVYTAISGLIAVGLWVLAAFHTYLMLYVRMGTYDWLINRRGSIYDASVHDEDQDPEMSGKEKKKQEEREEWQRIINHPRKKNFVKDDEETHKIIVKTEEKSGYAENRMSSRSSNRVGYQHDLSSTLNLCNIESEQSMQQACELRPDSSFFEISDPLNCPMKLKVSRKSFCAQKEPTGGSQSKSSIFGGSFRTSERVGTFIESSSCNDLTAATTDFHQESTDIRTDSDLDTNYPLQDSTG